MWNNATVFVHQTMQLKSFHASQYYSASGCNIPMDMCGNLFHMEQFDNIIVY